MESAADTIFKFCLQEGIPCDVQFNCENLILYATGYNVDGMEVVAGDRKSVPRSVLEDRHSEEEVMELLRSHLISTEGKKLACRMCSAKHIRLKSIQAALDHIITPEHQRQEEKRAVEVTLGLLPKPSPNHCVAVGRSLREVVAEVGISKDEVARRKRIVEELNIELRARNDGILLELIGPSRTGLGLKVDDFDVTGIGISRIGERLTTLSERDRSNFGNFLTSSAKIRARACLYSNSFVFRYGEESNFDQMRLNIEENTELEKTDLFEKIATPLLRHLVIGLCHWAQVRKLDNSDKYGVPRSAFIVLCIYYLQQLGLLPTRVPCESANRDMELSDEILGFHWIGLLKMCSEVESMDSVINIRGVRIMRSDNLYLGIILPIEDPVVPQRSLFPSNRNALCGYAIQQWKQMLYYFGIPRSEYGALYDGITIARNKCVPVKFPRHIEDQNSLLRLHNLMESDQLPVAVAGKVNEHITIVVNYYLTNAKKRFVLLESVPFLENILSKNLYFYQFEGALNQTETLALLGQTMIRSNDAKTSKIERIERLPLKSCEELTKSHLANLSSFIVDFFESQKMNSHGIAMRDQVISDLERCVRKRLPYSEFYIFGSSANGFGTNSSDIDICVTAHSSDDMEIESSYRSETQMVLSTIRSSLFSCSGKFSDVVYLRHARVPIVKFRHTETKLEGDISASNYLGYRNTKLIKTYCDIDPRVRILGLFLKHLVKSCGIGGTKDSLSSYGFALLVIHYLQQVQPPVIPVLQEIHSDEVPKKVGGWNTYFFDDLRKLLEVWPEYGQNQSSVGELFLGMCHYFANVFQYETDVITIRQKAPLRRHTKLWSSRSFLSIEDPFVLSYDVGQRLSRKLSVYIINTFGRIHRMLTEEVESRSLQLGVKSFNMDKITKTLIKEAAAADVIAYCNSCKMTGHYTRKCPEQKAKKELKSQDTERKNGRQKTDTASNTGNRAGAGTSTLPNRRTRRLQEFCGKRLNPQGPPV